jgi:hypothetical protein
VADAAVDGAVAVAVERKLGCGPEGMKTDLSNAMASSQKRVLRGGCRSLHYIQSPFVVVLVLKFGTATQQLLH